MVKNRWLGLTLFSLAGIVVIALLLIVGSSLLSPGNSEMQMGSGMANQGMQMGPGMMGMGPKMMQGMMGGMGPGMMQGMGPGMMGSGSSGSLGSSILNVLIILAVVVLFIGLIGFVYNAVKRNLSTKPETAPESKRLVPDEK